MMGMWEIKRILVPIDGSDMAKIAVNVALDIARQKGAEVITLFVVDVPHRFQAYKMVDIVKKDIGEPAIHGVIRAAEKEGLKIKAFIEEGHAADTILRVAERENIDLIVMGTRGTSVMKKLLVGLGSIASAVVAHAHCSVLVVRERGNPPFGDSKKAVT